MKVLVIGSGGREHALCWAIAASPLCSKLYCAPGNGGIEQVAECLPEVNISDHGAIVGLCCDLAIDFVVVGPEAPLVAGLVDVLDEAGFRSFGPNAAAAQLEGSKGFLKDLCAAHGIPTAGYGRFKQAAPAREFVTANGAPIVVKADGLAAGKGVIIANTEAEANTAIDDILGGQFGDAGAEVVVEEFLDGEEASFFALVDGATALPLATAQDHKRVGDGDTGPNTGGMGAYSPAPVMTDGMCDRVMAEIINPTVAAMNKAGTPFKGVLFAGLMITNDGPQLIEYNVRFGDPECQVLMMRLKSDLLEALIATSRGSLAGQNLQWRDEVALAVVLAARGYPGSYDKNTVIGGLDEAQALEDIEIFHAGTRNDGGVIRAVGGRVLNVTALGASVADARSSAYNAVDRIDWPDGFCRRDIGWRAIGREAEAKD